MAYPAQWMASTDDADKTGVATFQIEGVTYTLHLRDFDAFQLICKMLAARFDNGAEYAANDFLAQVEHIAAKYMRR